VLEALARVTSQNLGRIDEMDGHIDWATDWAVDEDGRVIVSATIVQQSARNPYSVVSNVTIALNGVASQRHLDLVRGGAEVVARQLVFETIADMPELDQFRILLSDAEPVFREIGIRDPKVDLEYWISAKSQRLGEDSGRDILVPIGAVLKGLVEQTRSRIRPLGKDERRLAMETLRKYRPGLKIPE
jgi:hypothetical protein